MAADEPPYLTIGTDVSAKYKGAFCEAKIKKVNRIVKCKVTFKNNLGAFVVTDDLIKGPLRIGADVEAKHPEKNNFLEAVINKLQDYSQYTVVFDDGDETTLRRTSLCLKSGRHFAESPTLDQFPLTNPEHFGTPVIGSGKFKRKRRSTLNSSVDYESSDEDSLPRKLKAIRGREKDPDLGKVVCVDYGDRRKKDNWYPGLIVPLPPQNSIKISKEEHLIRSFKDGKYYQVPKRDIRDYTKESGLKVENNALRTAVEKATLYLEKEELPPQWEKILFIGLDEEESNDSESDSSDDEPSEEKDRFVAQLYKFMDERGTPINKAPTVSNRDLNLYKLFKIMHKLGGYNKVTNKNKWKTVYSKMGLPHSVANGPNQVKTAYKRYLQSFEDFYRKLGCTMTNNSRSTRGRHRSDRNIIITRTRDRETMSPKSKNSKESKEKSSNEKKNDDKSKAVDKKDSKPDEEKTKVTEKKKSEDLKREERRRVTKKEEETKPEKARTREDARKEKNDSPEKKGTRSSLKIESDKKEKEEVTKEKKSGKEKKEDKPIKEEKPKKEDTSVKDRKSVREKRTEEKRENPPREKRDMSKEKNEVKELDKSKGKKEETKLSSDEKSPKKKLERAVKREVSKSKPDETEVKESEKKEEKLIPEVKEQIVKKSKLKRENSVSNEEEIIVNYEDSQGPEARKQKLKIESEEEPPSTKGKRKFMKNDDKEDKETPTFSDSDESLTNDSEKHSTSKDLKKEIEIGDRVKVKYGRGRMQKVYEAKVLKTDIDGLEKRYYVHYAGWNMRYDEWVRKNYIVAIVNGSKKFESNSKTQLPPSSAKKQERTCSPGAKSVRKNSVSSSTSSISRSTRSEKKDNSDSKKKMSNKGDSSTMDASQDSDSDRDDENDADVEDSSAAQADSFFKYELFSDDEEKEKIEDIKCGDFGELDKSLEGKDKTTSDTILSENNVLSCEDNLDFEIKSEPDYSLVDTKIENESVLSSEFDDKEDRTQTEEKEEESEVAQTNLPASAFTISSEESKLPSSETDLAQSIVHPELEQTSINKSCPLNFSGLIQTTESLSIQKIEPVAVESTISKVLPPVSQLHENTDFVDANLNIDLVIKSEETPEEVELKDEILAVSSAPAKSDECCENTSISEDGKSGRKDDVELVDTGALETLDSSAELSSVENNEMKNSFDSTENSKDPSGIKSESEHSIFMPSFSPQNVDQPFNKFRSDNIGQSEAVDVSKMIPGILERLKNDVISEFDVHPPQKSELTFDFLRESSNKCMSRSESSSSLRICESDTNDSNTDSKDFKLTDLPVSIRSQTSEIVSKSCSNDSIEMDSEVSLKVLPLDSNEKSDVKERITITDSNESETKKSVYDFEIVQPEREEFTLKKEQLLNLESSSMEADESETKAGASSFPSCPEVVTTSNASCAVDSEEREKLTCKIEDQVSATDSMTFQDETSTIANESCLKEESPALFDIASKETTNSMETNFATQILEISECTTPSQLDDKTAASSLINLQNLSFSVKKEVKKKKFGKKLGKKYCSLEMEKEDRDSKLSKSKTKKKMKFEGFNTDRSKNLDLKSKSKKLKKNKNKKKLKLEDSFEAFIKKTDEEDLKLKRKEKKKSDRKFYKTIAKSDDCSDIKMDLLKKKKGKKNRDRLLGEKKDFSDKKIKKKRKLHVEHNQDTDSEKETSLKIEKKRKKKKPKLKDCSSSDDCAEKFFKEESIDLPSTSSIQHDSKIEDPDMSFLLCEEKVPASPVGDTSSSNEDSLLNVTNTSTVMDNTPPTTPSSTESLLSSSPTHEPYPESTQSGAESDIFRCGSSQAISHGSEEYHAATTLAFAVGQSVSEKPIEPPQKTEVSESSKRKKKSKRFRRISESTKSPKHKLSYLYMSRVENCFEDSSGTSLATVSCSPPYNSLSFARSVRLSSTSEDVLYMPLHEKDPEKRIALLQKKMSDLRKEYLALRAEVIAIDHKRRKARKKVRETGGSFVNPFTHSEDGQSCS